MKHSKLRAMQRYNVCNFNEHKMISAIRNDDCVEILTEIEKNSIKFLVKQDNRYYVAVTNLNVDFVYTVLPYEDKYFDYVCKLVEESQRKAA